MSPKARLWLWLGAPLTTIVALLIGVVLSYRSDMTLRKPPLAPVLFLIVVCALFFQRLRKASWEFWKAIPFMPVHDFRFLLLPHLVACAGGFLCAAALFLDGIAQTGWLKTWYHSTQGTATFTALIAGGAAVVLIGLLWSNARQKALRLRE